MSIPRPTPRPRPTFKSMLRYYIARAVQLILSLGVTLGLLSVLFLGLKNGLYNPYDEIQGDLTKLKKLYTPQEIIIDECSITAREFVYVDCFNPSLNNSCGMVNISLRFRDVVNNPPIWSLKLRKDVANLTYDQIWNLYGFDNPSSELNLFYPAAQDKACLAWLADDNVWYFYLYRLPKDDSIITNFFIGSASVLTVFLILVWYCEPSEWTLEYLPRTQFQNQGQGQDLQPTQELTQHQHQDSNQMTPVVPTNNQV